MNAKSKKLPVDVIDDARLQSEVSGGKLPVLAAFLASWSNPCQRLEPVLDEVASSSYRSLKVIKLNVDDCIDLSAWYEIEDVPTLLYFVRGKERVRIVGMTDKKTILSKLKAFSPAPKSET